MTKVLVTGANGYIGTHVVNQLIGLGHQVIACDFRNTRINSKAVYINEDIFSEEGRLYERLGSPDYCIHLAWRDGFKHNSMAHMEDLCKHYKFLIGLMRNGLKSLSVMGTMHEVGYWEGMITENTPCNPMNLYGIAKNALKQALINSSNEYSCKIHWLRAYYITGDDKNGRNIFSKITEAVDKGQHEFPFTTGENMYDFIDVDVLSHMIISSTFNESIEGVIDCCTGQPISLGEKVTQFIQKKGYNIKLLYGAYPNREYDSPAIWGDNTKIMKILENVSDLVEK